MTINSRLKFVLTPLIVLASGCSANMQRIDSLERSLNDLRAFQAEQNEAIEALDKQVRQISGRLEELDYTQKRNVGGDLSSIKEDLSQLRKRIPPPSIVPASELEVDETWANNLPDEAKQPFLDAMMNLREGKFSEASAQLRGLSNQIEEGDKAGVILFWLGVANDGMEDDKGALRAYTESISRFPKNPRAAASLLRQAEALRRLGDKKTAQLSLQKLISDYPKSPEADRAREKMKSLR